MGFPGTDTKSTTLIGPGVGKKCLQLYSSVKGDPGSQEEEDNPRAGQALRELS